MGWNSLSRNESINRDAQQATRLNCPGARGCFSDYPAAIGAIHEAPRLLVPWCRPRHVVPLGAARVQRETLSRVAGMPHATRIISPPASIPQQDATAVPMDEPQTLVQVYLSVAEHGSDLVGSCGARSVGMGLRRRLRRLGSGSQRKTSGEAKKCDGGVVNASERARVGSASRPRSDSLIGAGVGLWSTTTAAHNASCSSPRASRSLPRWGGHSWKSGQGTGSRHNRLPVDATPAVRC
jgi:hypothetical protein